MSNCKHFSIYLSDRDGSPSSDFDLQVEFKTTVYGGEIKKFLAAMNEWYFDTSAKPISFSRAMSIALGANAIAKGQYHENQKRLNAAKGVLLKARK